MVDGDEYDDIAGSLLPTVQPADEQEVAEVRQELGKAKRDLAGFVEGNSPHLSIEQAVWVTTRSGVMTDAEACALSGISPHTVQGWRKNPEFEAILQESLANKREGFRLLGTQLLPKTLLTMVEKLDSSNERIQLMAAKQLLETQGMLITTINKQSKDSVLELVAFLREPQEVVANTNPHIVVRGLPSPEDLVKEED